MENEKINPENEILNNFSELALMTDKIVELIEKNIIDYSSKY